MITVYVYQKCSTCRNALQWLDARSVPYEIRAICDSPPSEEELRMALKAVGGEVRKVFNTSGMDYREMGLKDQILGMSPNEAFALMKQNGNLVKRPFLIGDGKVLLGFKQDSWEQAFS